MDLLARSTVVPILWATAALSTPLTLLSTLSAQEPQTGLWGSEPILREELRIGNIAGPPEFTFGTVAGLVVLADESIWLLDSQQKTIFRYDGSGRYLGSVGREGEGPGEFRRPQSLAPLGPDRAVVWDNGLGRLTTFDIDGSVAGSFRGPPGMVFTSRQEELMVSHPDAIWVLTTSMMGSLAGALGDPDRLRELVNRRSRWGWVRFTPAGATIDTVWVPDAGSDPETYGLEALATLSPQGDTVRVVSEDGGYTLQVGGRSVHHASRPVAFAPGERAEIERNERVFASRRSGAPQSVPEFKAPVAGLWIDYEGKIWVQRATEADEGEQSPGEVELRERYDGVPRTWFESFATDVFDANGIFLGQVAFPQRRSTLLWAAGDEVWVRETGEYGEHYVVKYRIAR